MRAYELMVIIDGDVDDPKAQSYTKMVVDEIEGATSAAVLSGTLETGDTWQFSVSGQNYDFEIGVDA